MSDRSEAVLAGLIVILFFPIVTVLSCSSGFQQGELIVSTVLSDSSVESTLIKPNKSESLYFAIITWTTLGYGDFIPTKSSRIISITLALCGYLYASYFIGFMFKIVPKIEGALNSFDSG